MITKLGMKLLLIIKNKVTTQQYQIYCFDCKKSKFTKLYKFL